MHEYGVSNDDSISSYKITFLIVNFSSSNMISNLHGGGYSVTPLNLQNFRFIQLVIFCEQLCKYGEKWAHTSTGSSNITSPC